VALGLPAELGAAGVGAVGDFACLVPASYLTRIERGNHADPLLLQVLPAMVEAVEVDGFTADPVNENSAALTPGLLQKYPGRALLIVTSACPVHCRYCFRRHFPYDEHPVGELAWASALALRDDLDPRNHPQRRRPAYRDRSPPGGPSTSWRRFRTLSDSVHLACR
jgi:L-lysine 2,3-aminomutase